LAGAARLYPLPLVPPCPVELAAIKAGKELCEPEMLDDPHGVHARLRRREEEARVASGQRLEGFRNACVELVLEEPDRSEPCAVGRDGRFDLRAIVRRENFAERIG